MSVLASLYSVQIYKLKQIGFFAKLRYVLLFWHTKPQSVSQQTTADLDMLFCSMSLQRGGSGYGLSIALGRLALFALFSYLHLCEDWRSSTLPVHQASYCA